MSKKIEAEEITSRRKLLVGVAGVAAGAGLLATGGAAAAAAKPAAAATGKTVNSITVKDGTGEIGRAHV